MTDSLLDPDPVFYQLLARLWLHISAANAARCSTFVCSVCDPGTACCCQHVTHPRSHPGTFWAPTRRIHMLEAWTPFGMKEAVVVNSESDGFNPDEACDRSGLSRSTDLWCCSVLLCVAASGFSKLWWKMAGKWIWFKVLNKSTLKEDAVISSNLLLLKVARLVSTVT